MTPTPIPLFAHLTLTGWTNQQGNSVQGLKCQKSRELPGNTRVTVAAHPRTNIYGDLHQLDRVRLISEPDAWQSNGGQLVAVGKLRQIDPSAGLIILHVPLPGASRLVSLRLRASTRQLKQIDPGWGFLFVASSLSGRTVMLDEFWPIPTSPDVRLLWKVENAPDIQQYRGRFHQAGKRLKRDEFAELLRQGRMLPGW